MHNPSKAILHSRVIHPNEINRPTRNLPKRNRRGGAYVPAQTFAQRRFHTKKHTCCVRGINDECALVGRHGRAHRLRPYPSPSYFSTQSYTNKRTIYMQSTPTTPTARAQFTKRNRRGGACVPARTSAQRRFHTNILCRKTTIHLI